jgi:hypothetical protein
MEKFMTFKVRWMPRASLLVLALSLVAGAVAQQKLANYYITADKLPWYKE